MSAHLSYRPSLRRGRLVVVIIGTAAAAMQAGAQAAGAVRNERPATDTLTLTFDTAVLRALREGEEVRAANASVDVADAQIGVARSTGLPQLRLNSTYSQVVENARANIVGSVFGQAFTYQANAQLSQPLFLGGRVLAGAKAAGAVRGAARASTAEVRSQVVVDVERAYLEALFTRRLVEIQRRNLELATARVTQAQQLETAGRASRYDVLRLKVERANLEPALVQAQNDSAIALLNLRRLVNVPQQRPMVLTSELDTLALQRLVATVDTSPGVGEVRAAVRAAELTRTAREAGVRVARADLFPSITATLTSGFLALPGSNGLPTSLGRTSPDNCPPGSAAGRVCQNNGWFTDRNFGFQVSWPIFDGLRTKANIENARAQVDQSTVQLALVREQVALEGAAARAEFARARTLFDARRETVAEASEAYELSVLRNTRGVGTVLDVSDAQFNLVSAQVNAARAIYDVFLAAAELARATGRPIPLPDGGAMRITDRGADRVTTDR
ncbi:MAG TPA: TolC family protein [Gemmatimonadaceae bacterium]|nr:TolC family protein [Gemmatimonadaceae bacterium]